MDRDLTPEQHRARRRSALTKAGLLLAFIGALGWTGELSKFGAHVFSSDPHRLITFGGAPLVPAVVESPYIIRVAIALLMLAASIPGKSTIKNATPVRRAHPHFAENVRALGAQIEWVEGD